MKIAALVFAILASLLAGAGDVSANTGIQADLTLPLSAHDVDVLNQAADLTGEPHLPLGTKAITVYGGIVAVVVNPVDVPGIAGSKGVFDTGWKYVKCVAAVGAAFIPFSRAYAAIKGLGGVVEAAKLLIKAGSVAEFRKIGGNLALDILGIAAIQNNCF
ncbi:hypothetical protein [Williamsia sp. CHRR-6]|uniref:hypothetical protein n=1 Tax=Williamsia sp. CHRR-6 TaxID=2835871 RepID=UPI001BDB3413|nr:hypothetical protein [Williamsia sp. CHRR-6]MBT0566293.1 hypothetical protein [Williamsia sp. CHRR-6]